MKLGRTIQSRSRNISILGNNLKLHIYKKYIQLFAKNNINICYNKYINSQYDPRRQNVLLALESPAVIESRGWLKDDMVFVAEISFANFYNLEHYFCCRQLYVNNDNFINIKVGTSVTSKSKLVSVVCSDKTLLAGHQLRHQVVKTFSGSIDPYGSGYHKFGNIDQAFHDYRFQVVIENGKYPEYVSEKFFDCIKTQTIPIYWGGELAVRKMGFDENGIIFFDTMEGLSEVLASLTVAKYEEMYDSALYNLGRLIELRNQHKMQAYLSTVMPGYMQTTNSYLKYAFNQLNLSLDQLNI